MPCTTYEVIVIGAGPAGASAATVLGMAGKRVLLLDKATFPRDKTCGDGITFRALPCLDRLGILNAVLAHAAVPHGLQVTFTDGTSNSVSAGLRDEPLMFVLPRFDFDHLLLQNARRQRSIEFLDATVVTGATPVGSSGLLVNAVSRKSDRIARAFSAMLVIDASGAHSPIVKSKLAAPRITMRRGSAIRAYCNSRIRAPETVEVILDPEVLPGYLWMFPISHNKVNVGCGSLGSVNPVARKLVTKLATRFVEVGTLSPGSHCLDFSGGMIPSLCDLGSRVRDRLLFCGDAGAFCDPISGEGISYALRSGILAAETAIHALENETFDRKFLQRYDVAWHLSFGNELAARIALLEPAFDACSSELKNQNYRRFPSAGSNYEDVLKCLIEYRRNMSTALWKDDSPPRRPSR